jgi:hypothetical protein
VEVVFGPSRADYEANVRVCIVAVLSRLVASNRHPSLTTQAYGSMLAQSARLPVRPHT